MERNLSIIANKINADINKLFCNQCQQDDKHDHKPVKIEVYIKSILADSHQLKDRIEKTYKGAEKFIKPHGPLSIYLANCMGKISQVGYVNLPESI